MGRPAGLLETFAAEPGRQRQDADAGRGRQRGLPHPGQRSRAILYGAAAARRSDGAGQGARREPRRHCRAAEPGGGQGQRDPRLVRPLPHRTGASRSPPPKGLPSRRALTSRACNLFGSAGRPWPVAPSLVTWGETMKHIPLARRRPRFALAAIPVTAASIGHVQPAATVARSTSSISSDAFEGRGPATRAETKTINYIADQFKAAGLQPGGDMVERPAQLVPGRAAAPVGDRRHAAIRAQPRQRHSRAADARAMRSPFARRSTAKAAIDLANAPLRVRRLRSRRARAQLGRFQGPGRPRQDASSSSSTTPISRAAKATSAARR